MAPEEYPSVLGPPVELTDERRDHILRRHPVVASFPDRIGDVIAHPEKIRRSVYDPNVLLLSRFYADILGGKHLVVVVKTGARPFVLTVYVARRLGGEQRDES